MKKQISATGPWEGNSLGTETNTRERETERERERETAQFYLVSLQRNTMMHIFLHETSRSRHKALTTLSTEKSLRNVEWGLSPRKCFDSIRVTSSW